ncbi:MAG: hypothetical protein V2A55_02375 [Candidatus Jorgensenbacteria bacterium]
MEFVLKSILLSSFFLVALFGFSVMANGSAHCLVSLMEGAACPENLFGFASFHIGFFKNFSSAVFNNLGLLTLFLILGFLSSSLIGLRGKTVLAVPFFSGSSGSDGEQSPSLRKIRRWFSLLETSPTFALAR